MRKYLFGSGIIPAIVGGLTLLRGSRDSRFTWREALGWISWGITFALAVGAIVDMRRAAMGAPIDPDSPAHGKEAKLRAKRLRKIEASTR
ncbi:hypothetical protein ACPW96_08625 [Micromonospora sp. DT81.3]|uniref:hypothetical protein n=1 Tax=Actinomycetes TaxID=1760 RepID=UPI003CE8A2C6